MFTGSHPLEQWLCEPITMYFNRYSVALRQVSLVPTRIPLFIKNFYLLFSKASNFLNLDILLAMVALLTPKSRPISSKVLPLSLSSLISLCFLFDCRLFSLCFLFDCCLISLCYLLDSYFRLLTPGNRRIYRQLWLCSSHTIFYGVSWNYLIF